MRFCISTLFVLLAVCLLSAITVPASGQSSSGGTSDKQEEAKALLACGQMVVDQLSALKIPDTRGPRFQGKVSEATALCRGGAQALQFRGTPWVDWTNYWGTCDMTSLPTVFVSKKLPAQRGVAGALEDLELQRIELIKFNLFDNEGTYSEFVQGHNGVSGPAIKVWPEMRLQPSNPNYKAVGGDQDQVCRGDLIRWRTVTGICNDILNPDMGSSGMLFARNVEFETSFPDLGLDQLTRNRHGSRLSLLEPDPQVISRRLLTRIQSSPDKCQAGYGLPGDSKDANCDYKKAPFFNVLAAYWIQFMTHDWFSHLEEGHNSPEYIKVGCETKRVNNVEVQLTPEDIEKLGCRPDDRMDIGYVAQDTPPGTFDSGGHTYLTRAPKTMANTNTAWWDASQLYGFDDTSRQRVKRDHRIWQSCFWFRLAANRVPGIYRCLERTIRSIPSGLVRKLQGSQITGRSASVFCITSSHVNTIRLSRSSGVWRRKRLTQTVGFAIRRSQRRLFVIGM